MIRISDLKSEPPYLGCYEGSVGVSPAESHIRLRQCDCGGERDLQPPRLLPETGKYAVLRD